MMCFLIKTISPTRLEWKKFFVDLILFVYAVYKIISMEEKECKGIKDPGFLLLCHENNFSCLYHYNKEITGHQASKKKLLTGLNQWSMYVELIQLFIFKQGHIGVALDEFHQAMHSAAGQQEIALICQYEIGNYLENFLRTITYILVFQLEYL